MKGDWRKLHHEEELYNLYLLPNVIKMKSRVTWKGRAAHTRVERLSWKGHAAHVGVEQGTKT
jgi:hypothetical protein